MGERQKLNEFGPVSYEDWLKLVERDLEGAPFEKKLVKRVAGVDIRPLYLRADVTPDGAGLPGFFPYARGSWPLASVEMGWDVRQETSLSDSGRGRSFHPRRPERRRELGGAQARPRRTRGQ